VGSRRPVLRADSTARSSAVEQTLLQDQAPVGKTLFYYTLGEESWKQTKQFPLPNTDTQTWYFQEHGGLSTQAPEASTGEDRYTVDFEASTGLTNRWHWPDQPLAHADGQAAELSRPR